ncbi:MAG: hypothetical protein ACE5LX_05120 [Nitrospinota bacterium]
MLFRGMGLPPLKELLRQMRLKEAAGVLMQGTTISPGAPSDLPRGGRPIQALGKKRSIEAGKVIENWWRIGDLNP